MWFSLRFEYSANLPSSVCRSAAWWSRRATA